MWPLKGSAMPLTCRPMQGTAPSAATKRVAHVVEDDADRGALGAQPETPAPVSRLAVRRHGPRWEPGALAAHAGICAGAASNRRPYRDALFSMTYEPHKLWWILPGGSPLSCSDGSEESRQLVRKAVFDPDLEQHGIHHPRPPRPAPETPPGCGIRMAGARFLNDALITAALFSRATSLTLISSSNSFLHGRPFHLV
jgi:hypothetical protein